MLFLLKLKYQVILTRFQRRIKQAEFHFKETFLFDKALQIDF